MLRLPVDTIHEFMLAVLKGIGVPAGDAEVCAEVLIASDLSGIESHGIGRLKMYYDRIRAGIQNPITKIEVVRDHMATAVWVVTTVWSSRSANVPCKPLSTKQPNMAWALFRCAIPLTMVFVGFMPIWPHSRT